MVEGLALSFPRMRAGHTDLQDSAADGPTPTGSHDRDISRGQLNIYLYLPTEVKSSAINCAATCILVSSSNKVESELRLRGSHNGCHYRQPRIENKLI